ncbi:hypothetical protein HYDPIDRAFT_31122 [Hydnomerulius pinastri MD-312]|uniref:Fungal pheromone STE3G-protein-coupled receptor n=1 Tax=Hydnomerulius pinastri MD-312 TaxID=994086 RepID=A0A0C9VU17_9AGAM|nr:hypothetical protein HYDPIDRAFT_31122 [Hydnomerulius pinastri MD-312]
MLAPPNEVFSVLSFLGAALVAIPLSRHLEASNMGTCLLMVWTELGCLVHFANSLRWDKNVGNWAPAWCDFCSRFLTAIDVALPATALCINRRLYLIVTLNQRRNEKTSNLLFDLLMGTAVPAIAIALQYIVQQYRFYIFEDIGCLPAIANVDLSYPIVYMLPLLVGSVSATYACLTLRATVQRKGQIAGGVSTNSTAQASWSRRLMALGTISTLFAFIPTSMSIILSALENPVSRWPGWTAVHSTNDLVVTVAAHEWKSNTHEAINVELRRWTLASLAFVIFAFLGFTEDAKKMYRQWAQPLVRCFGDNRDPFATHSRTRCLGGQSEHEPQKVERVGGAYLTLLVLPEAQAFDRSPATNKVQGLRTPPDLWFGPFF